jgi:putative colanic acid biosynthesis acetyltransferase WcaF
MDENVRFQDLSQFRMPPNFRGRSAVTVQLWWIVESTLFRWSPQVLYSWRSFLLRLFGASIGKSVRFRSTVRITYPWKLKIGDHVWVGDDCVFYNLGEIAVGSNVAIAHDVYLCTGLHDYTRIDFPIEQKPIHIEDEVWLPNDIFVGPGVTIGRGTIVGARSTVLKDLPSGMICYGHPAMPVRPREMTGQRKSPQSFTDADALSREMIEPVSAVTHGAVE